MAISLEKRYKGALFGLAVCDALGAPVEFLDRDSFVQITDFEVRDHPDLKLGYFTDDTSMALCLADSLIYSKGFKPIDQMYRYLRWYNEGFLSPAGYAFGIGNSTHDAIQNFIENKEPFAGSVHPQTAGNGSLMRLVAIPLLYRRDVKNAIYYAGESSRVTHQAPLAVMACKFYSYLIVMALQDKTKARILDDHSHKFPWLLDEILTIAKGSYKNLRREQVKDTGFVVHTLEAALWAFYHSDNFEEGAILAVNLGGDADTIGAVYGQLAGAYYGYDDIPKQWTKNIAMKEIIDDMAMQLLNLSEFIEKLETTRSNK
jgi:ADP-ribosyl-[dinitrogen reductase] hydrolase